MNCEKIKNLIPDYLTGSLEPKHKKMLDDHFSQCADCYRDFVEIKTTWSNLEKIVEQEPEPTLRSRFYSMLEAYQHGFEQRRLHKSWKKKFKIEISGWKIPQPIVQFVVILVCLFAGFSIGRLVESSRHSISDISQLRNEVSEMKKLVSLSLLNQSSSSARLKGISWSLQVVQPDDELISALLETLNSDPNVNVRLAAVDALYLFSDLDNVRKQLILSISNQTSPLIQISLIDLLVELKEKKSLQALKHLIKDQKVNPTVKKRAEWGIEQLI